MTVDVTNPTYNTVNLDPSAVTEDGNVWYAWSFATGGNGSWVAGTQSDDEYSFEVASIKDKVIFVRMNANGAPSWDSGVKLNQTNDLSVRIGGTYVITSLGTNNMEGYWRSESSNGKELWHQDPNGDPNYYLDNRRALVGRHCMANKLINVVGVGSWINDLNNLVDEDLSNYATFPKIADVGVGVNPVTSVRDTKNHYAAGTTAGFNVVLAADASLLDLDLANCFAISFYLEGELQQTVAVDGGQAFGGVGLSLITLPGSDEVCLDIAAVAPCEFDEIALMPAGVQVSVASTAKLRYAFVGDLINHTITQTSMQNYATDHGRMPFTLDQGDKQHEGGSGIGVETGYWAGSDLINDDLTDGVVWGVIGIGSSMEARVGAAMNRQDPDQSQPFKAGSVVGFSYGNGSLLNLPLGDAIRIRLYEGHWVEKSSAIYGTYYVYEQTEVQDESVKINVLSLNLIKGGNYEVTITANHDFSHARISFPTGLTLNVGGTKVKYAFICDPAEFKHQCDLNISADVALCSTAGEYQLTSGSDLPVTWSLVEQPVGANASVDQNGLLTGITVEGDYRVRATAADGCYEEVIVTSGLEMNICDQPVVNDEDASYVLSEEVMGDGGALINLNGILVDEENVLNTNYNDYATYANVLNLTAVENLPIVGVKKLDGTFSDGQSKRRIGFVVESKSTGLSADVIDLFNIRTYNNGQQTYSNVITETNVVKAKLIGSNKMQKLRFSIVVPESVEFDEFVLWKSGVLDLQLDKFKIYYAFDESVLDNDTLSACGDPLGCEGYVVSNEISNATLNSNEIQFAGAINAANVVDNLSWLVDKDLNTGTSVTNTISAGNGLVLAIDLGHVYTAKHQVGIVIDDKTYLARAKVGNWLTIKTYLNGVATGDEQSDWSVLGLNVIGYGDKSYLYLTPTKPYDEVRITVAAIADLLNFDTKYYGLFIRGDYDGDGTPDCRDDDNCPEFIAAGADIAYESEFAATDEENNYKNHVIVLNDNEKPISANSLSEGTNLTVYRYDKNGNEVGVVGTVTITGKTVNQDGTAVFNYSFASGEIPNADAEAGVKTTDDQFGTDEWGIVDFDQLHVTDLFSESTASNSHSDTYKYKLITSLGAETASTDFMTVPVLKTKHAVNAATYSLDEVNNDTLCTQFSSKPVEIMVEMQNTPNVFGYGILDVNQNPVDTVSRAIRIDDTRFSVQNKEQNGSFTEASIATFDGDDTQNVIMSDNTMRGVGNYVPVIHAYTFNESLEQVESTYGADVFSDEMPFVSLNATSVQKTNPFNENTQMGYSATLEVNSEIPNDQTPYLYRIWRVMPGDSLVLLNNLKDTTVTQDGNVVWETNYSALNTVNTTPFSIIDTYVYDAVSEGESMTIKYIVRLYSLMDDDLSNQLKSNNDGSYGMVENNLDVVYDDSTTTGVLEFTYDQPNSVTYYNLLGIASNKPHVGVNIVVTQYKDGRIESKKRIY